MNINVIPETKKPLYNQGLVNYMEQHGTLFLSGWRDSNPRPLRPERSTLPTEPHPENLLFFVPLGRLELPAFSFGNYCSIH